MDTTFKVLFTILNSSGYNLFALTLLNYLTVNRQQQIVVEMFSLPPQLNVLSSCLTLPPESPIRTCPTGIVTWSVCVRTFPSSSVATRWTSKTGK